MKPLNISDNRLQIAILEHELDYQDGKNVRKIGFKEPFVDDLLKSFDYTFWQMFVLFT